MEAISVNTTGSYKPNFWFSILEYPSNLKTGLTNGDLMLSIRQKSFRENTVISKCIILRNCHTVALGPQI